MKVSSRGTRDPVVSSRLLAGDAEILRLRAQNDTCTVLMQRGMNVQVFGSHRMRTSRGRYGVGVAASAIGSNV
jgi:hypothetical protein